MTWLIICLLLLYPAGSFAQEWKTFNDTSILFTAKYPADWVNKIKDGKKVFFTSPAEGSDDPFFENINISVTSNPQFGTTLMIKEIIDDIMGSVKKSFVEFTEENRTLLSWNGMDAYEITYSGNTISNDTLWVRITQRLSFYKTRLYLATYTALKSGDTHAVTARKIINSITFKP